MFLLCLWLISNAFGLTMSVIISMINYNTKKKKTQKKNKYFCVYVHIRKIRTNAKKKQRKVCADN